jgi:hypothetical protein
MDTHKTDKQYPQQEQRKEPQKSGNHDRCCGNTVCLGSTNMAERRKEF